MDLHRRETNDTRSAVGPSGAGHRSSARGRGAGGWPRNGGRRVPAGPLEALAHRSAPRLTLRASKCGRGATRTRPAARGPAGVECWRAVCLPRTRDECAGGGMVTTAWHRSHGRGGRTVGSPVELGSRAHGHHKKKAAISKVSRCRRGGWFCQVCRCEPGIGSDAIS